MDKDKKRPNFRVLTLLHLCTSAPLHFPQKNSHPRQSQAICLAHVLNPPGPNSTQLSRINQYMTKRISTAQVELYSLVPLVSGRNKKYLLLATIRGFNKRKQFIKMLHTLLPVIVVDRFCKDSEDKFEDLFSQNNATLTPKACETKLVCRLVV